MPLCYNARPNSRAPSAPFLLPYRKFFPYMSLSAQEKSEIIGKYQRESNDVGSPEVQVALLTSRISQMMKHFETHPKDRHSRYGLMKMVHARRGLLKHLRGQSHERYAELIQSLGLRR